MSTRSSKILVLAGTLLFAGVLVFVVVNDVLRENTNERKAKKFDQYCVSVGIELRTARRVLDDRMMRAHAMAMIDANIPGVERCLDDVGTAQWFKLAACRDRDDTRCVSTMVEDLERRLAAFYDASPHR